MSEYPINNHMFLISGKATCGKSTSLQYLPDPEGILYANCEPKRPPFRKLFREANIIDPMQLHDVFPMVSEDDSCHTLIIESIAYMMNMFETQHVITAADTQKAWGNYAQFFQRIMQKGVAPCTKNVIFTSHVRDFYNKKEMIEETYVKVKGSLMDVGIESFFNTVVMAKKMSLEDLEPYQSDYLNITEQDERVGMKHVFQTQLTKDTIGERIRGAHGLWEFNETFIDNNAGYVLERLHQYYG